MVTNDLIERANKAICRGREWLSRHQNPDGSFADCGSELVSTYKAPLAFAKIGSTAAGVRCLNYIKSHNLTGTGELASADGQVKTGFPGNQRNFANYMDGWVSIGAWLLGDLGFAQEICLRLAKLRSGHGGVPTGPEKWSGAIRYDILTNASVGRAFLCTGMQDEAHSVADFLCHVIDAKNQLHPDRELTMSFDDSWKRVEAPDPADRVYYQLVFEQRGERVFCPAFACAFLCEMAKLGNQDRYLSAARKYLAAIERTPEFGEGTLSNGKSGWAAGMLAAATGDSRIRQSALRIMSGMLSRQSEDGEFGAASGASEAIPFAKRLESTAEHVAWANEYSGILAAGL